MAAKGVLQVPVKDDGSVDTWALRDVLLGDEHAKIEPPLKLNLGCADYHIKGFINVDRVMPCEWIADLSKAWPWPASCVSEIMGWDIFEHLPDKIHTFNEAWRVLQPGGKLDLWVPTTAGFGAFQDPTHKVWFTPNDLFYFCEEYAEWNRLRESYGITAHFKVLDQEHKQFQCNVWKLRAILEAVKP